MTVAELIEELQKYDPELPVEILVDDLGDNALLTKDLGYVDLWETEDGTPEIVSLR